MHSLPKTRTPQLDMLDLPAEHRAALASNGFVGCETRATGSLYKLRYRVGGQQCVRSLGGSPERAAAIRRELALLQLPLKTQREARRAAVQAGQQVRRIKREYAAALVAGGHRFHGHTLRRIRHPPIAAASLSEPAGETPKIIPGRAS